jgi:preprotein translocase subunit SecF
MDELEQIKNEIAEIKLRNARVEEDKAWETSWVRKIVISIMTYVVIVLFFFFAGFPSPFLSAIVPTIGFLLSTFSISFIKKIWLKNTNNTTQEQK